MSKMSIFTLALPLLVCISCSDQPYEPGSVFRGDISFTYTGQEDAIVYLAEETEEQAALRESLLSGPGITDHFDDPEAVVDKIVRGAPIVMSKYEIPFMPAVLDQESHLSYLTIGNSTGYFHFALPEGLCGPMVFAEKYGHTGTGVYCQSKK